MLWYFRFILFLPLFLPVSLRAESLAHSQYRNILRETALFLKNAGFVDPRGKPYQEFTRRDFDTPIMVPGFRLPSPGATPVQFLTWNGIVLESTTEGKDADIEKALQRLTVSATNKSLSGFGWNAADEVASAYVPEDRSPLHALMLEMLGRSDVALKLLDQLDPQIEPAKLKETLFFHWSWALAMTGLNEFTLNRLSIAQLNLTLLEKAWISVFPELNKTACSKEPQNLCENTIALPWQEVLKDVKRRLGRATPPNCNSLQESSTPSTIIECLEEIAEQQDSFPGSIPFSQSAIFQVASRTLIRSLPTLVDIALHDKRLTRSAGAWRNFAFARTVLSVSDVAQSLLFETVQNDRTKCTELVPLLTIHPTPEKESQKERKEFFPSNILKLCQNTNWVKEALDALSSPATGSDSAAWFAATLSGSSNPRQALIELINYQRENKTVLLPISQLGEEVKEKALKLIEERAARALGEMQRGARWFEEERQESPAFTFAVAGARISPQRGRVLLRDFLIRLVATRMEDQPSDKITLDSLVRAYLSVVFLADVEDRVGQEIALRYPQILKLGSLNPLSFSLFSSMTSQGAQELLPKLKKPISIVSPTPLPGGSVILKLFFDGNPLLAEQVSTVHAACEGFELAIEPVTEGFLLKSLPKLSSSCTLEVHGISENNSKPERYSGELNFNRSEQILSINLLKQFQVWAEDANNKVILSESKEAYLFSSGKVKITWNSLGGGISYSYNMFVREKSDGSIISTHLGGKVDEPKIGLSFSNPNTDAVYELSIDALRGNSIVGKALGTNSGDLITFRLKPSKIPLVTPVPSGQSDSGQAASTIAADVLKDIRQGRSINQREANERIGAIIKLIFESKRTEARLELEALLMTHSPASPFAWLFLGYLDASDLNQASAVQNFIKALEAGDEFFKQAAGGEAVLAQARNLVQEQQMDQAFTLLNRSLYQVLKDQGIQASSVTEFFDKNIVHFANAK